MALLPSPSFPSSRCSWLGWWSQWLQRSHLCAGGRYLPRALHEGWAPVWVLPPGHCFLQSVSMYQGRRYLWGLRSTESSLPLAWRWFCLYHTSSLKDGKQEFLPQLNERWSEARLVLVLKSDQNTRTKVEISATKLTVVQLKGRFLTVFSSPSPHPGTSDFADIQASSYFLLMVHLLLKALDWRL